MHQYLFYIGDFPVRAYGLVLSLSIILASSVAYFLAKQDGRWHDHIPDMCIYSGMAGLLGARLWDVFSLTGAIISTILQKSLMCGREAWPFKGALC